MRSGNSEMSRLCIEKHDAPLDMTGSFGKNGRRINFFASQNHEKRRLCLQVRAGEQFGIVDYLVTPGPPSYPGLPGHLELLILPKSMPFEVLAQ